MLKKKQNQRSDTTVAVAMSGGVDSSIAAGMMMLYGYRVIGVTMKLWDDEEGGEGNHQQSTCCSTKSFNDARAVCQTYGIPHYVIPLKEEFQKNVVDNFVSEYNRGRTPNPCIICNTRIKWDALLQKVKQFGADYLATGHYARVSYDPTRERYVLKRGVSHEKDQSYALWGLSQENLKRTFFPIGDLNKTTVRKVAEYINLKTAKNKESQEICFIPDNDYPRFIYEQIKNNGHDAFQHGEIVTTDGEIVGKHKGYAHYTIGQRKGLGVSMGKPVYVIDIDTDNNRIIIGEKDQLVRNGLLANQINWIAVPHLDQPMRCFIKIRYRDRGSYGLVSQVSEDQVEVALDQPQEAITPGQSVVFYDDDLVIGGGIIQESY